MDTSDLVSWGHPGLSTGVSQGIEYVQRSRLIMGVPEEHVSASLKVADGNDVTQATGVSQARPSLVQCPFA